MMTVDFAPTFPWSVIIVLAALTSIMLGFGIIKKARGIAWRITASAGLFIALINPVVIEEKRERSDDVLAVVVDESLSQDIGKRREST